MMQVVELHVQKVQTLQAYESLVIGFHLKRGPIFVMGIDFQRLQPTETDKGPGRQSS